MPSIADGDAIFEAVQVNIGDLIVDADGQVIALESGAKYLPSGCKDLSCAQLYSSQQGQPVAMDQLVTTFSMLPGIRWSDGTPLTAEDSVFSFQVASGLPANTRSQLVAHTFSYQALDADTTLWRGLPGFRDPNYATNFFAPLPLHTLGALNIDQLLTIEVANKNPLSYGPYVIAEWSEGTAIKLNRNPKYYRAGEGLPYFDMLIYHFIGPDADAAIGAIVSGKCDILDDSINLDAQIDRLLEMQTQGKIQIAFAPGNVWEHLDFGIVPITYDEFYNVAQGDRPDFFGDARTRRAIAMCLNRSALIEQFANGQSELMNSYIPPAHPLSNPAVQSYSYDPSAGSALLQQVGWVLGEGGLRMSQGVSGIPDGVSFEIGYFTTDSPLHLEIAQILGGNLLNCGIKINISTGTPGDLFAPGPDGLLFGRQFDLAQFAWPLEQNPSCWLFLGEAVPGGDIDQFIYSWGGWNLTGWRNAEYDEACKTSQKALPGEAVYLSSQQLAQQIFASELPVIPLFIPSKFIIARTNLCGLQFDATGNIFWNIEILDFDESCLQTP
ncbi:MAG: hypothetical protein IIC79_02575 [Chloroflexi bacterium]|nr:hypothetical protein [Chloroflexota bacterium]